MTYVTGRSAQAVRLFARPRLRRLVLQVHDQEPNHGAASLACAPRALNARRRGQWRARPWTGLRSERYPGTIRTVESRSRRVGPIGSSSAGRRAARIPVSDELHADLRVAGSATGWHADERARRSGRAAFTSRIAERRGRVRRARSATTSSTAAGRLDPRPSSRTVDDRARRASRARVAERPRGPAARAWAPAGVSVDDQPDPPTAAGRVRRAHVGAGSLGLVVEALSRGSPVVRTTRRYDRVPGARPIRPR